MASDYYPIKISRPGVSNVYLRKRLFGILDKNLKNSASWVVGPAGAGKTTLVNTYITAKKYNCIWYQADDRDSDVAAFFHYIGIAAAKTGKKSKKPLPHFTPEYTLGLPAFARLYFQEFFARMKPPFALVIENCHEIPEDSLFFSALASVITEAPHGVRIILTSRSDPPPAFAGLIANRALAAINQKELLLTETEIGAIARLLAVKPSNMGNQGKLLKISRGWTAGVILMLKGIKDGNIAVANLENSAIEAVFNYFMTEIFEKSDSLTKDFLLKTALLPRNITVKAAEIMSQHKDSAAMLKKLYTNHFFIEKMLSAEPAYQYHPLFREFLAQRAAETFSKDAVNNMMAEAGHILEDSGLIEEAAKIYISIGEHNAMARLIVDKAQTLILQGRAKVVEQWTSSIPQDILFSKPWLLYYHGMSQLYQKPAIARKSLTAAYDAFAKENLASGEFLAWAGVVNSYIYEMNDFHPLDDWTDRFDIILKKHNGYPDKKIEESVSSCMFSALIFRRPDHPDIKAWAERAEGIMRTTQDKTLKMFIGYNLVMFWLRTCHIARAGIFTELLREEYLSPDVSDVQKLAWYRAMALYKFYVSSGRESLEFCKKGLELAETSGIHIYDSMLMGLGVYNGVAYGDFQGAADYLKRMSAMQNSPRSFDVMYYHHMASLVAAHQDRLADAIEHARTCLNISKKLGFKFQHFIQMYGYTYILAKAKKYGEMQPLIDEMHEFSKLTNSVLYDWACYFLEAFIDMRKGDHAAFFAHLGAAMNIVKERGIKVMAFFTPEESVQILTKALEANFETEHIKDLAIVHEYVPTEPMPWVESWPWPVKIRTLGSFELHIKGARVEFPRKVKQKPIELLKILLAAGGGEVSEERVSDILWPDADGDDSKSNFFTTLHRVRQLLDNDNAVRYNESMLSLDYRYCWVDTAAFEHHIKKSLITLNQGTLEAGLTVTEKICSLYKGHFLANDKSPWIVPLRERLTSKFTQLLEKIGKLYEDLNQTERAIEVYSTGIESDNLAETFYQRLMCCYAKAGKTTEALKTYNRCKRALSTHLNVRPSEKTEKIKKSIKIS